VQSLAQVLGLRARIGVGKLFHVEQLMISILKSICYIAGNVVGSVIEANCPISPVLRRRLRPELFHVEQLQSTSVLSAPCTATKGLHGRCSCDSGTVQELEIPDPIPRAEVSSSYPQPLKRPSHRRISIFRRRVRVLHSFSSENFRPLRRSRCSSAPRSLSFLRLAANGSRASLMMSQTAIRMRSQAR